MNVISSKNSYSTFYVRGFPIEEILSYFKRKAKLVMDSRGVARRKLIGRGRETERIWVVWPRRSRAKRQSTKRESDEREMESDNMKIRKKKQRLTVV